MWGKCFLLTRQVSCDMVHPHVCGVNELEIDTLARSFGSSPRMWGKYNVVVIIPLIFLVHPHVCGVNAVFCAIINTFITVHPHVCGVNILSIILV